MHRELEESHRSGRDGQLRMRGLEEQLLAAQDDCSKLNSQVRGVAVWQGCRVCELGWVGRWAGQRTCMQCPYNSLRTWLT